MLDDVRKNYDVGFKLRKESLNGGGSPYYLFLHLFLNTEYQNNDFVITA